MIILRIYHSYFQKNAFLYMFWNSAGIVIIYWLRKLTPENLSNGSQDLTITLWNAGPEFLAHCFVLYYLSVKTVSLMNYRHFHFIVQCMNTRQKNLNGFVQGHSVREMNRQKKMHEHWLEILCSNHLITINVRMKAKGFCITHCPLLFLKFVLDKRFPVKSISS